MLFPKDIGRRNLLSVQGGRDAPIAEFGAGPRSVAALKSCLDFELPTSHFERERIEPPQRAALANG